MKMKQGLLLALSVFLLFAFPLTGWTQEVSRLTKDKVKQMLDKPGVVVLDVRTGGDWEASTSKILGAIREDPRAVELWAPTFDKDRTYVLYCA